MGQFYYRAVNESGQVSEGVLDAASAEAVRLKLHGMELFPVEIHAGKKEKRKKSDGVSVTIPGLASLLGGVKRRDVLLFTQQLATLLSAGLTLDRSIAIIQELATSAAMKSMVGSILKGIEGGSSLADALARHPKQFGNLYVNMVRAGESGGILEVILARLNEYLEDSEKFRSYLFSVMLYPLLVLFVGGSAVFIIMTFVIPRFAAILADMGQTLPLSTQVLISISGFIAGYWYLILGVAALSILLSRRYLATDKGRLSWDTLRLKLPMIGHLNKKIAAARFSRTLGTLTANGVPILQALLIVREVIGNAFISRTLVQVHSMVKEGGGLSGPLGESGVFPPMAIHMITIGEESARLEKMLLKIAEIYETEVRTTVDRLTTLLEPLIIIVVALIVGFIVLSMVLAMLSMNALTF